LQNFERAEQTVAIRVTALKMSVTNTLTRPAVQYAFVVEQQEVAGLQPEAKLRALAFENAAEGR